MGIVFGMARAGGDGARQPPSPPTPPASGTTGGRVTLAYGAPEYDVRLFGGANNVEYVRTKTLGAGDDTPLDEWQNLNQDCQIALQNCYRRW